jgi:hypothetical protein
MRPARAKGGDERIAEGVPGKLLNRCLRSHPQFGERDGSLQHPVGTARPDQARERKPEPGIAIAAASVDREWQPAERLGIDEKRS